MLFTYTRLRIRIASKKSNEQKDHFSYFKLDIRFTHFVNEGRVTRERERQEDQGRIKGTKMNPNL
jgi:hypothetical protein